MKQKLHFFLLALCALLGGMGRIYAVDIDFSDQFENLDFEANIPSGWVQIPGWTIENSWDDGPWKKTADQWMSSNVSGGVLQGWNAKASTLLKGNIIEHDAVYMPAGSYRISAYVHTDYDGVYLFATRNINGTIYTQTTKCTSSSTWGDATLVTRTITLASAGYLSFGLKLTTKPTSTAGVNLYADNFKVEMTSGYFSNLDFEECLYNAEEGYVEECPAWIVNSTMWPNEPGKSDSPWPAKKDLAQSSLVDGLVLKAWNAAGNTLAAGKIISQTRSRTTNTSYKVSAIVHTNYDGIYLYANDEEVKVPVSSTWGEAQEVSLTVKTTTALLEIGLKTKDSISSTSDVTLYVDNFMVLKGSTIPSTNGNTITTTGSNMYLYNVETGQYLGAGASWNTQSVVDDAGIPLTITRNGTSKPYYYTLKTPFNEGEAYLGSDYYCDNGTSANFRFVLSDMLGTYYIITPDNKLLASNGRSTDYVKTPLTTVERNATTRGTLWKIVSRASRIQQMKDGKTDVGTFLITSPNFDRNWEDSGWTNPGTVGDGNRNVNFLMEYYNTTANLSQEVSSMPKGIYVLKAQGYYRPGGNTNASTDKNAMLVVGSNSLPMQLIASEGKETADADSGFTTENTQSGSSLYVPNTMNDASLALSSGSYDANSLPFSLGSDGSVSIGLNKPTTIAADWTIVDNFRLYYYGTSYSEQLLDAILPTGQMSETAKQDLIDACKAWAESQTAANYNTLMAKIEAAKTSVEIYKKINGYLTKMNTASQRGDIPEASFNVLSVCTKYSDGTVNGWPDATTGTYETLDEFIPEYRTSISTYWNGRTLNGGEDLTAFIANQGFELGDLTSWDLPSGVSAGEGSKVVSASQTHSPENPTEGSYMFYEYWSGRPIQQSLSGLPNGHYRLTAKIASGDNDNPAYVYLTAGDSNSLLTITEGGTTKYQTFHEATIDFGVSDGTVTIGAVGGNADGTFNAEGYWFLSADDFRLTYVDAVTPGGDYYLQNVETGQFINAGYWWGTHSIADDTGMPFELGIASNGGYTLHSPLANGGNQDLYLANDDVGDEYYCDSGTKLAWTFVSSGIAGQFYMQTPNDATKYLAVSGSSTDYKKLPLVTQNGDSRTSAALWKLVTRAERINQLKEGTATDATFLITNPNFGRNWDLEGWTQTNGGGGNVGVGGDDGNRSMEFWNTTYTLSQTISDLPSGYYALKAQGYYRPGGNDDVSTAQNAMLYAGSAEKAFQLVASEGAPVPQGYYTTPNSQSGSVVYVPNDMYSATLAFTEGAYDRNCLTFPMTTDGGSITIGAKKSVAVANDWTIIDNFRLYYSKTSEDDAFVNSIKLPIELPVGQMYAGAKEDMLNANAALTATKNKLNYDNLQEKMAAARSSIALYEKINNQLESLADDVQRGDIPKATLTATEAWTKYNDGTVNGTADATTGTYQSENEVIPLYKTAVSDYWSTAALDGQKDMTAFILNQSFALDDNWVENIKGWTRTGGTVNLHEFEIYNSAGSLQQTLSGLPEGHYTLKAQGYYRPGGNGDAGTAQNAILYAGTETMPLNLIASEGKAAADDGNGFTTENTNGGSSVFVPNNMTDAMLAFATNAYENSLNFDVDESGEVTIGVRKETTIPADWTIFDNFRLIYRPYEVTELTAEMTSAKSLLDGMVNIGNGVFQIADNESHRVALRNAYEAAENASKLSPTDYVSVRMSYLSLAAQTDAFSSLDPADFLVNAPSASSKYTIANYAYKDDSNEPYVLTVKGKKDASAQAVSYRFSDGKGSLYPQGISFETVAGVVNGYHLSYVDGNGDKMYLCTGSAVGSTDADSDSQIYATKTEDDALTFRIVGQTTDNGTWYLRNNVTGKNIGNADDGFYTGDTNYALTFAEAAPAPAVTLSVNSAYKFSTLMLPFEANCPTGVEAYTVSDIDGNNIVLEQAAKFQANVPYIVYAENGFSGSALTGYGAAYTDPTITSDRLTGTCTTDNTVYIPAGKYVLSHKNYNGVEKVGFYRVTADNTVTLPKNKVYFDASSASSSVKEAYFFGTGDDETGLSDLLSGEKEVEGIYDVKGVRLPGMQKGVNVVRFTDGTTRKVQIK